MKSLIAAHNRAHPFTHDLQELTRLLEVLQELLPIPVDGLFELQPYAVKLRYDAGIAIDDAKRNDIRHMVAILREHVLTRILALESSGPAEPRP